MKLSRLLPLLSLVACSSLPTSVSRRPANVPAAEPKEAFTIESQQQFDSMATASDGIVKTGGSMKFVIDLRDPASPIRQNLNSAKVHFINGRFNEPHVPDSQLFHFDFVRNNIKPQFGAGKDPNRVYEEFNNSVYYAKTMADRRFIVGTIQYYDLKIDGQPRQFYGIQFYPQDFIKEEILDFAIRRIQERFKIDSVPLAFVALGAQQILPTGGLTVPAFTLSQVVAGQKFIVMNPVRKPDFEKEEVAEPGVLGILKLNPEAETLSPIDIPVFKQLPLDLSVVAGVITYAIQDAGSHINLKSKERQTPDVVVLDEGLRQNLERLNGKPVFLIASPEPNSPNAFRVETRIKIKVGGKFVEKDVDLKMVEEAYRRKLKNRPEFNLKIVEEREVKTFEQMCPDSKTSNITKCLNNALYGGKATKLGFLAHKRVLGKGNAWLVDEGYDYRVTPMGFGVPLTFYQEFVAKNPELRDMIKEFLRVDEDPKNIPITQEDQTKRTKWRVEELQKIREAFYRSHIPNDQLEKLKAALTQLKAAVKAEFKVELKKVKVRSSANVEDIPGFDGAGLHDSYAAKVKKDKKTWADVPCRVLRDDEKVEEDGDDDDKDDGKADPDETVEVKANMEPKTIACAIKGVYASLWNQRAVEERSFKNIKNAQAAMGLAVVPEYNLLEDQGLAKNGNSVIITRVINTASIYGYTMSTQTGDSLVTNPTPGTQTEVAVASFLEPGGNVSFSYTQYSKPNPKDAKPLTTSLYSDAFMTKVVHMVQHVEEQYCLAMQAAGRQYNESKESGGDCTYTLYDVKKTRALDIEFKYLGDEKRGRLLCKQVREFSGH